MLMLMLTDTFPLISSSIQKILDDDSDVQVGEEKLAALTAGDRIPWAQTRKEYFSKGLNKIGLAAIESAVFFVALDDAEYNYDVVRILFFNLIFNSEDSVVTIFRIF